MSSPAGSMVAAAAGAGHHLNGTDIALIVVVVLLVALTGYLALSETAITRMSRVKAVTLAEERRRGARTLLRLVERIERVLPVVLFALELCTLVAATLVGVVASDLFGGVGVVVATVFEVVVIFVLAELAPKTWAIQHSERAALAAAPFIRLLDAIAPLRWVTRALIWASNVILPGKGIQEGPYVSEELLRAMADEAAKEEVIESQERTLIHSIIDFGDTVVRDVMVPRPDMVAVESHGLIGDVVDIAIAAGYSRIPAYAQGIDDVVGIVYVKDLMRAERSGRSDQPVSTIMREAQFTPESKRVSELMREMQAGKYHMAIVVDEYGGTAGLVTLEDLIEELVGEITDEYDIEEMRSEKLADGSVVVNARLPVDEVNDLLDGEPLPEGESDTVGGLVYRLLGHVPTEGEVAETDGYRLAAERVQGRRIGRVRVTPAEVPGERPAAGRAGGRAPEPAGADPADPAQPAPAHPGAAQRGPAHPGAAQRGPADPAQPAPAGADPADPAQPAPAHPGGAQPGPGAGEAGGAPRKAAPPEDRAGTGGPGGPARRPS